MGIPVFERKRKFGAEFTDFSFWNDNNNAKQAKTIEVINIDEDDEEVDDDDDYSLGFIFRLGLKLGKSEISLPKNDLAMPQVMNYDIVQENLSGCSTEPIYDAARMVCEENSYELSTESTDDSAIIFFENRLIGQENSNGFSTELSDGSKDNEKNYDESLSAKEESSEVAPEIKHGRLDGSIDCEVVRGHSCEPATSNASLVDSFTADHIKHGRLDGSIDCEVVRGHSCEPATSNASLVDSFTANQIKHGRLEGSIDCEVVRGHSCEPATSNASLIDSFTADQIREHLRSFKVPNGIVGGDNICQLCAKDILMFAPRPMVCASCVDPIKPGSNYYKTLDEKYSFCTECFKYRGGHISVKEQSFPKDTLIKGNDVSEIGEMWVRCDKCQRWQHQICALYNSKHDVDGNMAYICPLCRLIERQEMPNMPVFPILGARDLPRTILSDHLEQRLSTSLIHERKQRAESLGMAVEEVPGAEDLVIRTVLAVDKQIKVKPQVLDILHGEKYPSEFPYKSKAIMLFQKVEGAEVCLFTMYVQEFGSECGQPNQRTVYISYIDSVNYFTPDDIRTVKGQPLRTFVYHEILIGYLDYCKERGFNACYIWASPPLKGDDYIFYCHPVTQKTPTPEKLSNWYKMMLTKAVEDNVVEEYTNFYEHLFVPKDNQNSKITVARLPYFDGCFWTSAVESKLEDIGKKCKGDSRKKMLKKSITKNTLKSMGHNDLSDHVAKDIQVMTKLRDEILRSKDNFLVVKLQFICTNCHGQILSGNRWSCNQCKNFHLCERCIGSEQNRDGLRTHTMKRGAKHALIQTTMKDIPDTNDNDIIIDNAIFENRHAFLNFCQSNNYQFDTLRRAKHSSMMILSSLHKTKS